MAGEPEVRRALRRARRVYVGTADQLVPKRLTKSQARRLLDGAAGSDDFVLVTARFIGPDLVIRTVEWLGDAKRLVRPAGAAPGSGASSDSEVS